MKKLMLALCLTAGAFTTTEAQVQVNINIGRQPIWGPVGYDYVDYYYMPDIDVFYNVPSRMYYYEDRGRWRSSLYMPVRYRSYDIYNSYKVVINNYPRPYMNIATYRTKYSQYRGRHDQRIIRYSDDSRYWENRDHPKHNQWKGGNGNGNGNGNNGNKGKGRRH